MTSNRPWGHRVLALGPGWESGDCLLDRRVQIEDLPYASYPEVMRRTRLLCSVAVQEGGPLSFPEGLACGCSMLSVMTGLPLSFTPGCEGVWHMAIDADVVDWVTKINEILRDSRPTAWPRSGAREHFLKQADYEQLGQKLAEICFPKSPALLAGTDEAASEA